MPRTVSSAPPAHAGQVHEFERPFLHGPCLFDQFVEAKRHSSLSHGAALTAPTAAGIRLAAAAYWPAVPVRGPGLAEARPGPARNRPHCGSRLARLGSLALLKVCNAANAAAGPRIGSATRFRVALILLTAGAAAS
jgi:hypothetical protein